MAVVTIRLPDPAAAQRQPGHGRVGGVGARSGEDHLVGAGSDGGGDHVAGLVEGLGRQPSRAMQSQWVAPAGIVSGQPGASRIRQQWLARRGVKKDCRIRRRHVVNLRHSTDDRLVFLR